MCSSLGPSGNFLPKIHTPISNFNQIICRCFSSAFALVHQAAAAAVTRRIFYRPCLRGGPVGVRGCAMGIRMFHFLLLAPSFPRTPGNALGTIQRVLTFQVALQQRNAPNVRDACFVCGLVVGNMVVPVYRFLSLPHPSFHPSFRPKLLTM